MGASFRFPRSERLKGRDEIREVFSARTQGRAFPRKKVVSCFGVKLFVLENALKRNRIAFTFARKYGNAVARNRSRRLSREVFRHLRCELRTGYDMALLVYPGKDVFSVRLEQMRELFARAGLLSSRIAGVL